MQDFANKLIAKIPAWLRWVLVLPGAVLGDLVAQTIYRLLFYFISFHAVRPFTDELAWRFFAPIVFVVAGVKMAPRFWFYVACILIAIKSAIASVNIYTLVHYVGNGGSWSAPVFVTNAPVWWSVLVQTLFIAFAVLTVAKDQNIRKEPIGANAVLDF